MCRAIPKPSSLTCCDKILTRPQIQSPLKPTSCHHPTPVHLGMVNDRHRSIGMSRVRMYFAPGRVLSMCGVYHQINQDERGESPWKQASRLPGRLSGHLIHCLEISTSRSSPGAPSDAPSIALVRYGNSAIEHRPTAASATRCHRPD